MANTLHSTAAESVAGTDSGIARAVNRLPYAYTNVSGNERWLSLAASGAVAGLCLTGRTPPQNPW